MKTPSIQIHDAQRRVDGKRVNGYRVKLVAKNGEILQVSEVLNTPKAVEKHINALLGCVAGRWLDKTKGAKCHFITGEKEK